MVVSHGCLPHERGTDLGGDVPCSLPTDLYLTALHHYHSYQPDPPRPLGRFLPVCRGLGLGPRRCRGTVRSSSASSSRDTPSRSRMRCAISRLGRFFPVQSSHACCLEIPSRRPRSEGPTIPLARRISLRSMGLSIGTTFPLVNLF